MSIAAPVVSARRVSIIPNIDIGRASAYCMFCIVNEIVVENLVVSRVFKEDSAIAIGEGVAANSISERARQP